MIISRCVASLLFLLFFVLFLSQPEQAVLSGQVIVGSLDTFAQPHTLGARFDPSSVQLIEGADHFFNGYDGALTRAAEPFFNGT